MIYDETDAMFASHVTSCELALIERARRALPELTQPVAVVAGAVIYFYEDRVTLDADQAREGGCDWANAAVVVQYDNELNFEIVE